MKEKSGKQSKKDICPEDDVDENDKGPPDSSTYQWIWGSSERDKK